MYRNQIQRNRVNKKVQQNKTANFTSVEPKTSFLRAMLESSGLPVLEAVALVGLDPELETLVGLSIVEVGGFKVIEEEAVWEAEELELWLWDSEFKILAIWVGPNWEVILLKVGKILGRLDPSPWEERQSLALDVWIVKVSETEVDWVESVTWVCEG